MINGVIFRSLVESLSVFPCHDNTKDLQEAEDEPSRSTCLYCLQGKNPHISQGFDPLLPEFSMHLFMNEEIESVKGYPILTYQREEPATGFSVF